ncbi:hypothetical protein J2TS6_42880 [Paenibacillus albilobatus]|uniref:YolD-like family protein n=1 Tax=Paenibacillus albilobatus TaxID=2716884 RepID=A0A920CDU1_9BACL|nr:YolD-like family protein [Paenibacillus albilobatus]GIO33147.1 hypothetical protein J2TS6_42880 [Paenibacillus albilobatus]
MYAVPKPTKTKKDSRPSRDDFELQELAEQLDEARESRTQLSFTIWRKPNTVKGIVTKMDPGTQRVHIQTSYEGILKVPFLDILRAEHFE